MDALLSCDTPVYFTIAALIVIAFLNWRAFCDGTCSSSSPAAVVSQRVSAPKAATQPPPQVSQPNAEAVDSPATPDPTPVLSRAETKSATSTPAVSRGRTPAAKASSQPDNSGVSGAAPTPRPSVSKSPSRSTRSKTPSRSTSKSTRRSGSPPIVWEPYTPGSRKSFRSRKPAESSFPIIKQ